MSSSQVVKHPLYLHRSNQSFICLRTITNVIQSFTHWNLFIGAIMHELTSARMSAFALVTFNCNEIKNLHKK